ncbi:MAG TPA: hypothetical protein PLH19_05150 [Anaerolineae bacterium]|nr:hypothetical protein [Anaerolineae bacterium]
MPDQPRKLTGSATRRLSSVKEPASGGPKSGGPKNPPQPPPSHQIISHIPASSPSSSKPKSGVNKSVQPSSAVSTVHPAPTVAQSDERVAQLADARTRWESLAGAAMLSTLVDQIATVTHDIEGLDRGMADIRTRGYRFGRTLDEQATALKSRWPQQQAEANRLLQSQRLTLQNAANEVQRLLGQAEHNYALMDTVDSRLWALENHINETQRNVRGIFDNTEQEIAKLQTEVRRVQNMLEALDNAAFDLLPDEHGVAACEARWISDNQQPEGMVFLTDSRVIFEQREERVIKKKLFSSEKELVQEKLWDAPVGAIEDVEMEDKKAGLFGLGRQELLTLRFAERTRELPGDVTLQLKGGATNEEWLKMIRQAKSGQLAADLFGAPTPQEQLTAKIATEAAAPPTALPTRCPNCNATLPPIYQGMKQVECQYCGALINI